jgi:hypothetical protein
MKRVPLFLAAALLGAALLAGCDATTSAPDQLTDPAVTAPSPLGDLNVALEDADRAFAALDAAEQTDEAYVAAINEALVRHFGAPARSVTVVNGGTERVFGPFNIAFGQQQTRFGTLNGTYPGTFDAYIYNVTGTQTGEFEGRMEKEGSTVGALLRINGQLRDQDSNEDNVTAEAIVTAPVRALVGVAILAGPTGAYEHRAEFGVPD